MSGSLYLTLGYVALGGLGSSVGITTDYWLDDPGSNSVRDKIFRQSRAALGPTHPPVQSVWFFPGVRGDRGVGLTPHPHLVLKVLERVELYL